MFSDPHAFAHILMDINLAACGSDLSASSYRILDAVKFFVLVCNLQATLTRFGATFVTSSDICETSKLDLTDCNNEPKMSQSSVLESKKFLQDTDGGMMNVGLVEEVQTAQKHRQNKNND
jgi:hypothetical protein